MRHLILSLILAYGLQNEFAADRPSTHYFFIVESKILDGVVMRVKFSSLIFLTTFFAMKSTLSFAKDAKESKQTMAVLMHAGQTDFRGDLTKDSTAVTNGWSLLIHTPNAHDPTTEENAVGGVSTLWIFDFSNTSTKAKKDTKFPFVSESAISITGISLLPTICAMATLPVQACGGVGFTLMEVRGNFNEQHYGTFRGALRLGRYLGKGLVGGIESHYYNVSQRMDRERSSFAGLTYQASIGFQW